LATTEIIKDTTVHIMTRKMQLTSKPILIHSLLLLSTTQFISWLIPIRRIQLMLHVILKQVVVIRQSIWQFQL